MIRGSMALADLCGIWPQRSGESRSPIQFEIAGSPQPCEPQLVRTLETDCEHDFVARRRVHPHLKIALEGAKLAVHLHRTFFNGNRGQLAPHAGARVAQVKQSCTVPRPGKGSKGTIVLRGQRPAPRAPALTNDDLVRARLPGNPPSVARESLLVESKWKGALGAGCEIAYPRFPQVSVFDRRIDGCAPARLDGRLVLPSEGPRRNFSRGATGD